jgi:class 3 adenylate cyclase
MSTVQDSPLQAARAAVDRRAWEEARNLYTEADAAGQLAPADLVQMAEVSWWAGAPDGRADALERAYAAYIKAGERSEAASVALQLAELAADRLATSIAGGWLGRAARLLEGEPRSVAHGELAVTRSFFSFIAGDMDTSLDQAEQAIAIGKEFNVADIETMALNLKGRVLLRQGHINEGLALLDETTIAATAGELRAWTAGNLYCSTLGACHDLSDWQRAAQFTEEADRLMRRQGISGYPGVCRVHRAHVMWIRGNWPQAEEEARQACLDLEKYRLLYAVGWGHYEIGEIRLRLGDLAGADEAFRRASELGHHAQPGLALLQLARGEVAAAAAGIHRALTVPDDPPMATAEVPTHPLGRSHFLPAQVEIALAAGDLETARAAADELKSTAASFPWPAVEATAAMTRGAVQLADGDPSAAVSSLTRSRRLWLSVEAPYEAARARAMLGEAYRAIGDEGAARMELEAARSTFDRLRALPDLRRVEGLLEAGEHAAPAGERQHKTFMFTDIVRSTDLVEAMGDDAWEELIRWHDATLRSLFARHGGEEVDDTGDGFFVAFPDARSAVEAAVSIQRTLANHRRDHGFSPRVRIGIHTAEATRLGRNYRGKGVHLAARVGAIADRDEIVVTTASLAGDRPHALSAPRTLTLKGIKEPIEIATVAWKVPPASARVPAPIGESAPS